MEVEDNIEGGGGKKKITQLLLNTPGACFLCLKDNDGGPPDPGEDLNGGIFNLSNICRHLNTNQCSLLSTNLKNGGGGVGVEDVDQDRCTFSVNLCPKCLELTQKLNNMLVQLEKTKLMVNFHLSSFHKVLEENLEWTNLPTNSGNSLEVRLVQDLREEAEDKSFKLLKKAEQAMPQVILSKYQGPPAPPKMDNQPPPPPPPSSDDPWSTIPSTSSGTTVRNLLSHLVSTNLYGSRRRCPYCTKILSQTNFPFHLSSLHPSKLLSSYFPPTQPPTDDICRRVLFSRVVTQRGKSLSPNGRLGCHLCGMTYDHGTPFKHHFLVNHTDQLVEDIKKYQKSRWPPSQLSKTVDELIKIQNMKRRSFEKVKLSERKGLRGSAAEEVGKDRLEEEGNDNGWFCGGDEGGDQMEEEDDDAWEFEVKPEVGELGELEYPDVVADELGRKEEEDMDYLSQIY